MFPASARAKGFDAWRFLFRLLMCLSDMNGSQLVRSFVRAANKRLHTRNCNRYPCPGSQRTPHRRLLTDPHKLVSGPRSVCSSRCLMSVNQSASSSTSRSMVSSCEQPLATHQAAEHAVEQKCEPNCLQKPNIVCINPLY